VLKPIKRLGIRAKRVSDEIMGLTGAFEIHKSFREREGNNSPRWLERAAEKGGNG